MDGMIKKYLKENRMVYIFLILVVFAGTAAGAYYTRNYNSSAISYMKEFFDTAKNIYRTSEPSFEGVFKESLFSSLKTSGYIWILGFTVIGILFILFALFKSGFMLGFLNGFFIATYGIKGLIPATVLIAAKCLVYLPALLFLSCEAVKFSSVLIKTVNGKFKYRTNLKPMIFKYFVMFFLAAVIMIIYSVAESFICGNILKVYLKS